MTLSNEVDVTIDPAASTITISESPSPAASGAQLTFSGTTDEPDGTVFTLLTLDASGNATNTGATAASAGGAFSIVYTPPPNQSTVNPETIRFVVADPASTPAAPAPAAPAAPAA